MIVIMIVLSIIEKILLFLLTLLFLILIIPFEYEFNGKFNEKITLEVNILWMFKILKSRISRNDGENQFTLFIGDRQVITKKIENSEKNKGKKYKEESKKKDKSEADNSVKEYFQRKFLSDIWKYFKDIIKIITPSKIKIYGEYGFQDPSITGMLCGYIPLIAALIPNRDIRLEPIFDDEILDIDVSISGRIVLGVILIRTARFMLTETIRKKIFKKRKKVETY